MSSQSDNQKSLLKNIISLFDPLNTQAFNFDGYYGAKIHNGYLHLPKTSPCNYLDILEKQQWLYFGKIFKAMLTCFKNKDIKLKTLIYLSETAKMFRSLYLESFSVKMIPIFVMDGYLDFLVSKDPILYLEPFRDHLLIPHYAFNKLEKLVKKFVQNPSEFCKIIKKNLRNETFSLEDFFYEMNESFRENWLKTLQKYYQSTEELSPIHLAIKYGPFEEVKDIFKFIRKLKKTTQKRIFQNIPKEIQNVTKFLNNRKNYLSLLTLIAWMEDKNKKIFFLEQFGELLTILDQNMKPEKEFKKSQNRYIAPPLRLELVRFAYSSLHDPKETDEEKKKYAVNMGFAPLMKAFYDLNSDQWEPVVSLFKKEFQGKRKDIFDYFSWPSKKPEDIVKTALIHFHLISFYLQILKDDFIVDPEQGLSIIEVIQNFLKINHISDCSACLNTFLPDPSFIKKFILATKSTYNILKKLNTSKGVDFYKKISDKKFKHIMLYLDKNEWFSVNQVFEWKIKGSEWPFKLVKLEEDTASMYLSFLGNFDLSTDEKNQIYEL